MGYSTYFYVGAYLEITDTAPVIMTRNQVCLTEDCCRHGVQMPYEFCSSCGNRLGGQKLAYSARLHDLLPVEFEDELSEIDHSGDGTIIAIGNKRKDLPDCLELGEPPFVVELLSPDIAVTFVDNFWENYSDVIQELRKQATVEVKFGAIAYRL